MLKQTVIYSEKLASQVNLAAMGRVAHQDKSSIIVTSIMSEDQIQENASIIINQTEAQVRKS